MDELNQDQIILKLSDIRKPGHYISKTYNENKDKFEVFGELFTLGEDFKFYNKDGTGPWEQSEITELQEIVDKINEDKVIKFYFTPYFPNMLYKMYNGR